MSKETANNFKEFARYKYVIKNIGDVIWELDLNLVFTFVSPTVYRMTGYTAEEIIGRSLWDFLTAESKARTQEQWRQALTKIIKDNNCGTNLFDMQLICKDGTTIWCELCPKPIFRGKEIICFVGTTRNISERKLYENQLKIYLEELKDKNDRLEDLATMDMLTGAYNRRKLDYFIGLEIEKNRKYEIPFSIIMFDIDNFKEINDQHGHKKGDTALQNITALIKQTLRTADKLFRWGGDEFIILLPGLTLKNALKVADRVRDALRAYDFGIGDKEISISIGIGEYIFNETPDQFVTRVDNALLKAKFNGRNKIEQG